MVQIKPLDGSTCPWGRTTMSAPLPSMWVPYDFWRPHWVPPLVAVCTWWPESWAPWVCLDENSGFLLVSHWRCRSVRDWYFLNWVCAFVCHKWHTMTKNAADLDERCQLLLITYKTCNIINLLKSSFPLCILESEIMDFSRQHIYVSYKPIYLRQFSFSSKQLTCPPALS